MLAAGARSGGWDLPSPGPTPPPTPPLAVALRSSSVRLLPSPMRLTAPPPAWVRSRVTSGIWAGLRLGARPQPAAGSGVPGGASAPRTGRRNLLPAPPLGAGCRQGPELDFFRFLARLPRTLAPAPGWGLRVMLPWTWLCYGLF